MSSLSHQHVAILGAGRSGKAAARLALREGARVSVWDQGPPERFHGMPAGVETHPLTQPTDAPQADLLVVSPGIDTNAPLAAAFVARAHETIGEVELASRYYHGQIVGITGTNGKTTTTELVSRILGQAGLGGPACGNHGTPFSEIVLLPDPPAAVSLELSSFQLETIRHLRPDVAIWLNFAADHMDRYPSIAAYRAAKLRIFENLLPAHTAIVRGGEPTPPIRPQLVRFSTEDPATDWYSNGQTLFHQGQPLLDMERETSLRGLHNAENLLAALAAGNALGIPLPTMRAALQGYAPPPHRCELIRTLDGVEYLNDSKATNLHALESALRSQTRPVILIAGGKEKGLDYSSVLPLLQSKVRAAVSFGQIARPLAELFSQAIPCEAVHTLADAVTAARSLAPRGSTVLFSPGTSSFDQFTSYEQRGDAFRDLVHQLR